MAVFDEEVLAAGRCATMRVPLPFEWMSRLPPSCLRTDLGGSILRSATFASAIRLTLVATLNKPRSQNRRDADQPNKSSNRE